MGGDREKERGKDGEEKEKKKEKSNKKEYFLSPETIYPGQLSGARENYRQAD